MLRILVSRIGGLFRKNRLEQDLNDELRFHLDMQTEENLRRGMSPEEAAFVSNRTFGGLEQTKELYRDRRGLPAVEVLWQDLKYAFRILRKTPGFTAVAVASLALGIGANTAIFSLIDRVMLRALPVRNPEQLVLLGNGTRSGITEGGIESRAVIFSYPAYRDLGDRNQVFSGMLAFVTYTDALRVNIDRGEPEAANVKMVSGNYFAVLGVSPLIGRILADTDDQSTTPVAVLNYAYWMRRFARDPAVIGKTITIRQSAHSGTVLQVVGVAPPDFFGEKVGASPDFWIPLTMQAQIPPGRPWLENRRVSTLQLIGRLKPGMTASAASAHIDVLFRQIVTESTGSAPSEQIRRRIAAITVETHSAERGISSLRLRFSYSLQILMGVAGLVLLIACANIANLLLARAAARQNEIALRLAIGASRRRLIRQFLTESVLLASVGGALGVLLAGWGSHLLVRMASGGPTTLPLDVSPNLRILGFTAGVSLLTGILFGLAPALRATQTAIHPLLRGGKSGSAAKGRLGRGLVVAQVALSLLLLVGAGLFVRSFQNLENMDLGFVKENVLMFDIDPGFTGYKGAQLTSLYERILDRMHAIPGVRAASVAYVSFNQGRNSEGITVLGETARLDRDQGADCNSVGPRYFEAMGIPLRLGRVFTPADTRNSPAVAVVNEAMVRKYFPNDSPIGKRFAIGVNNSPETTIVGVVQDAHVHNLREPAPPVVYLPFAQFVERLDHLAVRAAGPTGALETQVRQALREVEPSMPVNSVRTLSDHVASALTREALIARLSTFFGLLALLLAGIGLYGVMSYSVACRTNEIGVRMALGAGRSGVLWFVLKDALWMIMAGVALGVPAALGADRLIETLLYGLDPADPVVILVSIAVLAAVAMCAAYLPARRASRVDPMVALRYD
jgi:predicted permease